MRTCLHRKIVRYGKSAVAYWPPRGVDYEFFRLLPAKRAAVMERAKRKSKNGMVPICEMVGCNRVATECHHSTYAHLGHEYLDDLLAVCSKCHHWLHRHEHPQAANENQFDLPLEAS
jgi:hypothetical protein